MSDARAINALAYETRVGSPLDFQPKRVSAPSCFRALRLECESRSSRKRRIFSVKVSEALHQCSAEVASVALHHCFANGDYLLLVNFSINALQTLIPVDQRTLAFVLLHMSC